MPIYGKNLLLLQNLKSYELELGIKHYVLKLYKVYINDDPALTLIYFTTMSNLEKRFLYLQ